MCTSEVKYIGSLRTEARHFRSGNSIITDAPIDNNGKGEAFSPTDLVATSLASCMLTIAGIAAEKHGFSIDGASADITKHMASDPRRICGIDIEIYLPKNGYSDKEKRIIEAACASCPVFQSLHPEIKINISYTY